MPRLLVVHHAPTRGTRALADAALAGTGHPDLVEALADAQARGAALEVVERPALEAQSADVLAADAVLLGCPANLGYMAGAMKHFFDTVFLEVGGALGPDGQPVGGRAARRPYGLWVHGRHDVTGAVRAVTSIAGALGWVAAAAPVELLGDVDDAALGAVGELGATLAALLLD